MDLRETAEESAFRLEARSWLEANVPQEPLPSFDTADGFARHREWEKKLYAGRWSAVSWPEQYGGRGADYIKWLIFEEEYYRAGAPGRVNQNGIFLLGPTIMEVGTDAQKSRFLPTMASSEIVWGQAWSEPNAGSDLASLKTSAVLDGDEWVINGQKIWTSFGAVADYCYLICRTSNDGPPHAGISEIVIPMNTPGIEAREIQDMTTNRHFCEVFFTDVRIPKENLVGTQGGAFKQTMRQLEHERGGIDRLVSNYALYAMALARADMSDPRVRQEVARLETGYRIGRILVIREVLRQAPAGFSAATKCFCTEHEQRVANFVAKTFGPEATLWDDVTAGLMYGPGYTIMGGTSNVMRNILGERVLGLPKEPGK